MHWGATSQDVIDTALVLELRAAIDALLADLDRAIEGFTALAGRHRRTATVARTWMQQPLPMPFGLKLAGYAAALARSRERLQRLRREALVLQFGGAAGTLAALGERGLDVAERLAALLDLPLPDAPWHSHRDRLAEVARRLRSSPAPAARSRATSSLLMQTEVGRGVRAGGARPRRLLDHAAQAQSDRGGGRARRRDDRAQSRSRPCCAAQVQEHERALGGWQAEWPTFPALALVTSGALAAVVDIAEGLEIDVERMRANLDATQRADHGRGGVVRARRPSSASRRRIRIVEEASRKAAADKRDLQDVLAEDERVQRC